MRKKWNEIFSFCLSYSNEPNELEIEDAKKYVLNLSSSLRCSKCRKHMKEYLTKISNFDDIFKSRHTLVSFFVDFYNDIKKMLNKPSLSLAEICKKYKIDFSN